MAGPFNLVFASKRLDIAGTTVGSLIQLACPADLIRKRIYFAIVADDMNAWNFEGSLNFQYRDGNKANIPVRSVWPRPFQTDQLFIELPFQMSKTQSNGVTPPANSFDATPAELSQNSLTIRFRYFDSVGSNTYDYWVSLFPYHLIGQISSVELVATKCSGLLSVGVNGVGVFAALLGIHSDPL